MCPVTAVAPLMVETGRDRASRLERGAAQRQRHTAHRGPPGCHPQAWRARHCTIPGDLRPAIMDGRRPGVPVRWWVDVRARYRPL